MGSGSSKSAKTAQQKQPQIKLQQKSVAASEKPVAIQAKSDLFTSNTANGPSGSNSTESELKDSKHKQAGNSNKGMSWFEVLDKVSNEELWEGTNRAERDPWKKYLAQADDILRRPRKPISKVCRPNR